MTPTSTVDDSAVDIRILGPLEIVVQGRNVALRGPRNQRLLALLAVNCDETVPFERIVDVLWDEPPSSARQQVHNVVGSLRRALQAAGSGIEVVNSTIGYRLGVPRLTVDAFRFQARVHEAEKLVAKGAVDETIQLLRHALGEWRGAALIGLSSRQLVNAATVLNDQRLAVVEHLAELHLRRGDAAASVTELTELVGEFPFRESLRAVLMRVLHRCGRQVEALAIFEEGRLLLNQELGLDPGTLLQAAHQQVLAGEGEGDLQRSEQSDAGAGSVPNSSASNGTDRRFLPRDVVEFTGRDDELQWLVDHAGQSGTTGLIISAINGMGGVGKTALAVHLAHKLAHNYPDGQYFIDLRGFSADADPLTPAQALSLLLRNSGVPPELVPSDLDARSALWRSQLAGRRALLLLDNAVDVVQVRPLLPGTPGVLVLISSRRRMASLEGAIPLPLGPMPEADALSLFSQIVGLHRAAAEPEAVSTVIELCGCLPLAIQIAAARLRDRPNWSVADVAKQLREQKSRTRFLSVGDRDVTSILAWSYRHLTREQQLTFRLLSIHPGSEFDAHSTAALTGVTLEEAAACLDDLFDVNLLLQHTAGHYRFHDLVRDCSRTALEQHDDPSEQDLATHRILDYYLRSANLWCKTIARSAFQFDPDVTHEPQCTKPAETSAVALGLLEGEFRTLLAAIRLAIETGSDSHVLQLARSLIPYLGRLNRSTETTETEEIYRQALRSARALGDTAGESACLMALAQSHRAPSTETRELAQQAIALSQLDGDRAMELYQRTALGGMYLGDNLHDEAFACFTSARDLACEVGDREAEADLTNNLGVISRGLGRLDEAQQYFYRTLILDGDTKLAQFQALTLCNIGQIHYLQGRDEEAIVQFDEALRMSRSATGLEGEAAALIGLSAIHRKARDFSSSIDCGRTALEAARNASLYDVEADALNALSDAYLSLGNLEMAERVLDQSMLIGTDHDSSRYIARAHEGQAHLAAARGDMEAAKELWQKALTTHPGGVVEADGARRHLAAQRTGDETCWRCVLVPGADATRD